MTQLVDWDLALSTGTALAKTGPAISPEEASAAVTSLRELSSEAERHVSEFTGLTDVGGHAPVRVVNRPQWISTNVEGMRTVAEPILLAGSHPPEMGWLRSVAAKSAALEAGLALAFLSGRVLGQFDVFSMAPGQLLLVAQNIEEAHRKLNLDPRDFRLWVCLHEVTHRTQFTAVPWLREYFLGQLREFGEARSAEGGAQQLQKAAGTLIEIIRNPNSRHSLLDIVQTPAQRQIIDRLMALMTLLEGHAEFVMDGVGPGVIPSVEHIRSRFDARRAASSPVQSLIRRLLGVELKLRQYAEGRRFVSYVVEQVGMARFNDIWRAPETIPTLSEFAEPDKWISRAQV